MALSAATLKSGLVAMLIPGQADPPGALASAFSSYMAQATAIITTNLATPKAAMAAAMTFSSDMTAAQGAAQFGAGCGAYWTAMAATPLLFFPSAVLINPAPTATMVASLTADFPANTSASLSHDAAMSALATSMHGGTVSLGTWKTLLGPLTPIV
jgi:hypothetical protein